MSITATYEPQELTVTAMVQKITEERMNREARQIMQDEKLTEVIINDTPGRGLGKHRLRPVKAAEYPERKAEPKDDFVAPTSLFELVNER